MVQLASREVQLEVVEIQTGSVSSGDNRRWNLRSQGLKPSEPRSARKRRRVKEGNIRRTDPKQAFDGLERELELERELRPWLSSLKVLLRPCHSAVGKKEQ